MRDTLGATLEDLGLRMRYSLEIEIEYDAWKGEPIVMNPPDKAYPGSDPGVELQGVRVTRWDVGEEERTRCDSWIWDVLDKIAEAEVEDYWDQIYSYHCLEDAAEQTEPC